MNGKVLAMCCFFLGAASVVTLVCATILLLYGVEVPSGYYSLGGAALGSLTSYMAARIYPGARNGNGKP